MKPRTIAALYFFWVVVIVLTIRMIGSAFGAPPSKFDPDLAPWFEAQRDHDGRSCCRQADGHILDTRQWRVTTAGFQILVDGAWIDVPNEKVLEHQSNPTGGAVAFYNSDASIIYCFILPEGV